jgi:hypothetical protein
VRFVHHSWQVGLALLTLAACRNPSASQVDAGPAVTAPVDSSRPRTPPPLRVAHPAAPPLPDLPALADHEAPAAAPAEADLGGHPCRAVWTGSQVAPLACAKALLFGATAGDGARALVPHNLLAHDPGVLPAVVDHRSDGTEGPVRNQGLAPACTAFATAAALDHALVRWSGRPAAVSVMQIWSRYHSPNEGSSLSANVGMGIGGEAQWPFDVNEAISWVACTEYTKPPRSGCGRAVNDARLQRLEASPLGSLTEAEYLGAPDMSVLAAKIAEGQDIVVTMELPSAFVPKGRAGARYVPNYTRSAGPDAGHALVLAGYARLPHGTYFLAHNSWGSGWGDGGYAWIHEQTLKAWGRESVALDADPSEQTADGRPARRRGETTCSGSLVLDSIRGTCTPGCPDGSPRHNGVCPVAGQCPAGWVNLTGACVLAAPSAKGSDPSTGIEWVCGPGGCSYVLPRSSDPTCTGAVCKASCPAPDFRIARMGPSLVCVE